MVDLKLETATRVPSAALFGVLVKYPDGTEKWMSDRDYGLDVWVGTRAQADAAAMARRHIYQHLTYEVKEAPNIPTGQRPETQGEDHE